MDDPQPTQSLFGPRVRMAPSPTGYFHIGSARTALFNFLFARKTGGKFILRIEDTDKLRSKKEYEKNILDSLRWLKLEWDEGPEKEGDFGPYRQSERLDIYEKYLKQLLEEGKTYYCFCSPEELEIQRQEMITRGIAPRYSGHCRDLSQETVKRYLNEGKKAVIRLRMPSQKLKFQDVIRGEIEVDLSLIGDIVIAKGLREPLYNFSATIDDYLMEITHVIRGEDHISNTPKQIILGEALGFPRPIYAHLPMILGPDRSKLSKRHGAMAVTDYRQLGYLPQALVNFLALLGWHPQDDSEVMSLEEIIEKFSLERVQKGGAIFNLKKLDWLNSYYLRKMDFSDLMSQFIDYGKNYSSYSGLFQKYDESYFSKVIEIDLPRINKFSDVFTLFDFFFKDELDYKKELLFWKGMTETELKKSLSDAIKVVEKIPKEDFNKINLQIKFYEFIDKEGVYKGNRGQLLWPLRAALSGKEISPGPFEIAEVLGKEETIKRLKQALDKLDKK